MTRGLLWLCWWGFWKRQTSMLQMFQNNTVSCLVEVTALLFPSACFREASRKRVQRQHRLRQAQVFLIIATHECTSQGRVLYSKPCISYPLWHVLHIKWPGILDFRSPGCLVVVQTAQTFSPLQQHKDFCPIFKAKEELTYGWEWRLTLIWYSTMVWSIQANLALEYGMKQANRVLPRERTGHSKHPLPTTQAKTLHMDITRWSTPIRLIIFLKSDWLYFSSQR